MPKASVAGNARDLAQILPQRGFSVAWGGVSTALAPCPRSSLTGWPAPVVWSDGVNAPRRSPEELEAIARFADALPVAIWVGKAPGGECVYVNREFERILGLARPEAARGNYVGPYGVHLPNGDVYPEDQMPYERAIRARGPVTVEDLVVHKHDGTRTYLRVFVTPLFGAGGEIEYVVEAFTDKSSEVETERLRAEGERLLRATQRLESIGSLAGGIAHDFNNMLAAIKIAASQLRGGATDEAARAELVDCIDEVTDNAARLTRALLGFAGRGKHRSQGVPLGKVIRSVVELGQRTFDRRITLHAAVDEDARTVLGDVSQIEQVVMNLVFNARDAVAERGGDIVVRTRPRELAPEEHPTLAAGRYVELTVTDTGPGVDPSVRDRMFEPYVTTKTTGAQKGTGLGLATVFGVVQSHNGHVELSQTGPSGTTMTVLLPAVEAAPASVPSRRAAVLVPGTGTLLVVDDEPLVLKLTADALSSLGYDVLTASTGREAVEIFRERGREIDAVVLDMIMPGLDGRATYTELRAMREDVPVLLMTGHALNEQAQEILDLGVRGFLSKPFEVELLSAEIAALVGEARRRGA